MKQKCIELKEIVEQLAQYLTSVTDRANNRKSAKMQKT